MYVNYISIKLGKKTETSGQKSEMYENAKKKQISGVPPLYREDAINACDFLPQALLCIYGDENRKMATSVFFQDWNSQDPSLVT